MKITVTLQKLLNLTTGLFLLSLPLAFFAHAQENEADSASSAPAEESTVESSPEVDANATNRDKNDEQEVDISDIADKYWRPQKDELEVVQNRRFAKTGRVEVSLLYGFYQTSEYLDSTSAGGSLTYNFSELWAVEASYLRISNNASDFQKSLAQQFNVTPNFNTEKSQANLAVTFTPIYAKFALLGRHISHFEPYLSLGYGYTETLKKHGTLVAAFGNRFFITKNFVLRLEWKRTWYTDEVVAISGAFRTGLGGPGFFEDDIVRNNLLIGLGWLF